MKCVSHQIAAFFRWCCGCSFSSTKLNCLRSAASKCQWSTNGGTGRNSFILLHTSYSLTKNDCIEMSGFLLSVVQVDIMQHRIWRTRGQSAIFHPQNIFSPLILHHVTHHHMSISPWFSLVKFIVINRSYWGGVPLGNIGTQCFCSPVTWRFSLGMLTNSWCMGICRRLCSRRERRANKSCRETL